MARPGRRLLSRLFLLAVGWQRRGPRPRSGRAAETQRRARRLRSDHGDRLSGDHGQLADAGELRLYAAGCSPISARRRSRPAAIIDRVTPVAFGVIFALTGSIGPIIGQNYGARLMGRVQRTLTDSFILSIGYVLFAWAVLALAAPGAHRRLRRQGRERRLCRLLLPLWGRRLALPRLPLRRQHRVQQPRLSAAHDGVQLGRGRRSGQFRS